jgi:hypothetical protein
MKTEKRRQLWKSLSSNKPNDEAFDERYSRSSRNESFTMIYDRFSSQPPRQSLKLLLSNALVVVQQCSLTAYMLVRHQYFGFEENYQGNNDDGLQNRNASSTAAILSALLLVYYYSSKGDRIVLQSKQMKLRQRSTDGCLIALLLRLLASVLRSLTASYSSDTVQALAIAGMILHLFAFDYEYANGSSALIQKGGQTLRRPSFQGGTMSLNASLFSTILLVSRLSSNATAYFYLYFSVAVFSFYPATLNAIAASFPAYESCTLPTGIVADSLCV